MCNAIGVDPLAGSNVRKGAKGGKGSWWAQMLGGDVNDFYFELAVRVVEVCRGTRGENGGLIGVGECRERVQKGKGIGGGMEVSEYVKYRSPYRFRDELTGIITSDDILRAVKSLKPLGSGFSIVAVGSKQMIRSIPKELNTDQSRVLEAIEVLGYVTVSMLQDNLNWEYARAETVIEDLLSDSLVWVDTQVREREYWSPAFMHDADDT